ncbi:hypothetical protein R1sor_005767 [Riccia sorocarpa]|uniref:Uncharacterized protein n=1 Tax=Riccia sorocarpa TaxID=122646 RepID=A0ABD3HMJ4_9MARC
MTMIDYLVLEIKIQVEEVPRASSRVNQISILMELPYCDGLLIQHLGDVMHEEEAMFYGSETLARLDASAPLNSLADKEDEREVDECFFIPALHMLEWVYVFPYVPKCIQIVQDKHDIHMPSQEEDHQ